MKDHQLTHQRVHTPAHSQASTSVDADGGAASTDNMAREAIYRSIYHTYTVLCTFNFITHSVTSHDNYILNLFYIRSNLGSKVLDR